MTFSGQVGYETGTNLEHFEDIVLNPFDPGSILFSGSLFASNIIKKRVNVFSWHIQYMLDTTQQNNG